MPSEAQKNKGYLLPTPVTGWDLICVELKIPDAPEYRAAFRGALKSLTEWWNWERTGDTAATTAATYWRQIINDNLIIQDCDELEFLDGDDMAQFDQCWQETEGGYKLVYTLNGGCTYKDVYICGTTTPLIVGAGDIGVGTPIDPNDDDGGIPSVGADFTSCQITNGVFYEWLFDIKLRNFIANVLEAPTNNTERMGALVGWIESDSGFGFNLLASLAPFVALVNKYLPFTASLVCIRDDEDWINYIYCPTVDCVSGDITRETLNCVAGTIDGMTLANCDLVDYEAFKGFFKDFIAIFPVYVLRSKLIHLAGFEVSDACDCEEPADLTCTPPEDDNFDTHESDLGYITLIGAANYWLAPTLMPLPSIVFGPLYHGGAGFRTDLQTDPPTIAVGIQKVFETPYTLCGCYVNIDTSSGYRNSRAGALWVQDVLGGWTCIAQKYLKVYKKGEIDLYYTGEPMLIQAIAVAAIVGYNNYVTIRQISINYNVPS